MAGEQRLGRPSRVLRRPSSPESTGMRCGCSTELRDDSGLDDVLVSGCLGPRGDGYVADEVIDADEAASYHAPQIEAFADAGADLITVLTLTGTGEASGSSVPPDPRRCRWRSRSLPVAVTRRSASARGHGPPSSDGAGAWRRRGREGRRRHHSEQRRWLWHRRAGRWLDDGRCGPSRSRRRRGSCRYGVS